MAGELLLRRYTSTGVDEVTSPSVQDAIAALSALDGVASSEFFITDETTAGICVVGGPDRFVCWVQRWEGDELVATRVTDRDAPAGTVRMTLGNGQVEDVSKETTGGPSTARRALRTFLEGGGLDRTLQWSSVNEPS